MAPRRPTFRHARHPRFDQYRDGPVPGSWVWLRTNPTNNNTVEEHVPLVIQLAQQFTISNETETSVEKISVQTFHPFERLATELRFQIRGYLLPNVRVVEFEPVEKNRDKLVIGCYSLYPKLASKSDQESLGVLPYACHDSRAFFLDNYHLSFDGFLRNLIYFSLKYDVLLFSNEYALELFTDALNLIPWAEARASVVPVRKAAIRWSTYPAAGDDHRSKTTLALEDNPVADGYKLKSCVLLEPLTTLEKFAFLYLFRSIDEEPKADLVNFVKRLENQMSERKEVAKKEGKKNTNIPLTPWASHVPEIVMLQCLTGVALQSGGSNDMWHKFGKDTWELGTREWVCSRSEPDYKSESLNDDNPPHPPHLHPFPPSWNPYHQFHQNPQYNQHNHHHDRRYPRSWAR